jgi:hypothetical protein
MSCFYILKSELNMSPRMFPEMVTCFKYRSSFYNKVKIKKSEMAVAVSDAVSQIWKNMIFWRKIVIFHTEYTKNVRTSLRSAQFSRNQRYFVIKLHRWFYLSYFLKANIKLYCIYQYFMNINSFFNTVIWAMYFFIFNKNNERPDWMTD